MIAFILAVLLLPDPGLTPGAVTAVPQAQLCHTRWGLDRRHVTRAMRRERFRAYGIPWRARRGYEVDHLVPRELGGADETPNLWPQRWPEARRKDRLENWAQREVCAGRLDLEQARARITTDWAAWYHEVYGP
jgi:hypothetical protein